MSSYGGFWIGTAIILTPGGFEIITEQGGEFDNAFGMYLMVRTLRQTSIMNGGTSLADL